MNIAKKHIINIFVLLLLLFGYSGLTYPTYPMIIVALIIFWHKLRYDKFAIFLLIIILIFLCLKLFAHQISSAILTIKYFFGFFIFYLLFRQHYILSNIDYNLLLIAVSGILITEAVLINTIFPAELWLHFPKGIENEPSHMSKIMGLYQRPYGFGTNASITTTLIITLLFIRDKVQEFVRISKIATFISIVAVLISSSGVGLLLLFVYLVVNSRKPTRVLIVILLSAFCFSLIFVTLPESELFEFLYKVSPVYFEYLLQLKSEQINMALGSFGGVSEFLFGKKWLINDPMPLGGDFGLLNFIEYGGIMTLLIYLAVIIKHMNKTNRLAMSIMLIGLVHYAAIFSTPGQIIFAFCLALDHAITHKSALNLDAVRHAQRPA